MAKQWVWGLAALLISPFLWAGVPDVEVQGLFTGAAILKIDGQTKMVRVGQSFGGVTVIAADSRSATLDIDGEQHVLRVSQRINSVYAQPEAQQVSIHRNTMLQYHTMANINGQRVKVLVDTGANIVALNAAHARSMGLRKKEGKPVQIETASGIVNARLVTLRFVDVGGIRVENVEATVLDGDHPSTILLGMSYLRHVEMHESGGVLSLTRAY